MGWCAVGGGEGEEVMVAKNKVFGPGAFIVLCEGVSGSLVL
jgi:hypothetical protein